MINISSRSDSTREAETETKGPVIVRRETNE